MKNLRISLEQWVAFQTVIDEGGFAQAAQKLNRSQSTISYSIEKIESLLNTKILKMNGRKAELTESGRKILLRSREITKIAIALEHAIKNNATDDDREITLAYDAIIPRSYLLSALYKFSQSNHSNRLILKEGILSGPAELFSEGKADIAIVSKVPSDVIGKKICDIESVAYAHPTHPLHELNRPLNESDLKSHRHIVVMDSAKKSERSEGWLSSQNMWNVDSINLKIDLVASALGFAWLPSKLVEERHINLKPLPLIEGAIRHFPLYIITKPENRLVSAFANLLNYLENSCQTESLTIQVR